MKIDNIKATKMELTPAISDYATKRLGMLDKFVKRSDTSAFATIEVGKTTRHHLQGDFFFAEINVHIAGKDLRAVAEKDDLYAAIDEAKDEIVRELTHHKDKQQTLVRRGGVAIKNILKGIGDFGRGVGGKITSFRFKKYRK